MAFCVSGMSMRGLSPLGRPLIEQVDVLLEIL